MMRRLFLFLALSAFPVHAQTVKEIDSELQSLTLKLEELRKEEYNAEIESQESMRANWGEFAKKLSEAEKEEKEQDEILQRIAELKAKKEGLLKQKP